MRASLVLLAAMVTVAYAVGQYYVPRSYYTIDSDGHETAPVPLRRLRRSLSPYPYTSGANANANARASAHARGGGGSANANANSIARSQGSGGFEIPAHLGSSGPNVHSSDGMTRSQSGRVVGGRSVSATSDVAIDSSGSGFYDQTATIHNFPKH